MQQDFRERLRGIRQSQLAYAEERKRQEGYRWRAEVETRRAWRRECDRSQWLYWGKRLHQGKKVQRVSYDISDEELEERLNRAGGLTAEEWSALLVRMSGFTGRTTGRQAQEQTLRDMQNPLGGEPGWRTCGPSSWENAVKAWEDG